MLELELPAASIGPPYVPSVAVGEITKLSGGPMGLFLGGFNLRMSLLLLSIPLTYLQSKVILYPAPSGMPAAADRKVTADGSPVFVYEAPVNFNRIYSTTPVLESTPVAYFDFSGTAAVTVTAPGTVISSAILRPLSYGVVPVIAGEKISFTLTRPGPYTLELNGNLHRALHLFADSIEANPRTGPVGDMLYYGPGIHNVGNISTHSGQTIYISGGAVVYGSITGDNVNNFKLAGRGILHGGNTPRDGGGEKNLLRFFGGSHDFSLTGVILFDSPTWNVNIRASNAVKIDDLKIIGARANSDGIDLVSCQNINVKNCFIRAWDDCLCVKTDNTGNAADINFNDCVLWTDLAQSMEVGYETRSDYIRNITFQNIDVIHNLHKPVMSIHVGDRASVEKVRWENIRIEDKQGQGDGQNWLIDLWVGTASWTVDAQRGKISGVVFKNISTSGPVPPRSRIYGFDASHLVTDVSVENLSILGKPIKSAVEGSFAVNTFITAPTFIVTASLPAKNSQLKPKLSPAILGLTPDHRSQIGFRSNRDFSQGIRSATGKWMGSKY
jgi:hypothetical protein